MSQIKEGEERSKDNEKRMVCTRISTECFQVIFKPAQIDRTLSHPISLSLSSIQTEV